MSVYVFFMRCYAPVLPSSWQIHAYLQLIQIIFWAFFILLTSSSCHMLHAFLKYWSCLPHIFLMSSSCLIHVSLAGLLHNMLFAFILASSFPLLYVPSMSYSRFPLVCFMSWWHRSIASFMSSSRRLNVIFFKNLCMRFSCLSHVSSPDRALSFCTDLVLAPW